MPCNLRPLQIPIKVNAQSNLTTSTVHAKHNAAEMLSSTAATPHSLDLTPDWGAGCDFAMQGLVSDLGLSDAGRTPDM
jgi:hypothetical protein